MSQVIATESKMNQALNLVKLVQNRVDKHSFVEFTNILKNVKQDLLEYEKNRNNSSFVNSIFDHPNYKATSKIAFIMSKQPAGEEIMRAFAAILPEGALKNNALSYIDNENESQESKLLASEGLLCLSRKFVSFS